MSRPTLQHNHKSNNIGSKDISQNNTLVSVYDSCPSRHLDLNTNEFKGLHRDVQNSNLSKRNSMKSSDNYMDQSLTLLVNDLINKVTNTDKRLDDNQTAPTKLHKFSSPFMMKNSLNNSIVSTVASDDNNSCERSNSDVSCKEIRSDSLIEDYFSNSLNGDSTDECLEKIFNFSEEVQNSSQYLKENKEHTFDTLFVTTEEFQKDTQNYPINAKKATPMKYKTEICRNWETEGFCSFGDKCIFAHGSQELNKKNSVASNYKTKICKQFSESPFYCPYGEKCQFVHLSYYPTESSPDKQTKYSIILKETLKNIDKRISNMNFIDAAEESVSLYKSSRLSVFRLLTENCIEEEFNKEELSFTTDSSSQSTKKTALSKTSKEFIMPKNKTPIVALNIQQTKKGKRTSQRNTQPGY